MRRTHIVQEVEHLTESTTRLRLDRKGFQFRAGQHVNVGLPASGVNREYSIYSGEQELYLDLLVKEVEGGVVSPQIKGVAVGDAVELDGPYGEFVIRKEDVATRKFLFVGSGTGIAPFRTFVRTHNLDYQLIHGIRYAREQYHAADYEAGRYIPCVSREPIDGFRGRVTDYLREFPVEPRTVCYLCGNRSMINDAYDILRKQGVSGTDIIIETFF